jgi:hypothetical protein
VRDARDTAIVAGYHLWELGIVETRGGRAADLPGRI